MSDLHPAEQYVDDVLSGRKDVCKWVRLACERHRRDLEDGHERGLWFDENAASRAITFFSFLKHSKGEWAGQSIALEPWQQFTIWAVFGWKREDGLRRFRTAYEEVPRKNGKTTKAAGVGLYLFDADSEPGAEIYTAATKRDQARIAHAEATRMVKASPFLRRRIGVYKDNLNNETTASKFEPLGRDADSLDGLNVHGAIIDEVHAHKTRDLWDVIETATGARRQPLLFAITTAGFDRQSLCYELHTYTEQVLDGSIVDDTFFGIIYTIDEGDDPFDEATWAKANPNYGVSVKPDDMRRLATKAQEMPSAMNAFLRLRLNVWTQSVTRWMNMERWTACGHAIGDLRGRRCYGGLDLATTTDLAGYALVFPPEADGDRYQVLWRLFVPEDAMKTRSRRDKVPYDAWVRQGLIQTTPGDVLDYGFILASIDDDAQQFDIMEMAFDRWGATLIYQQLEERGMTVVQFGQGFQSMSPPMKELERMVLGNQIAHGNHPVATWAAGNLVAREDPAGNIKPDKEKSTEKIDPMVMMIMALDRATRNEGDNGSVYEERGVLTI